MLIAPLRPLSETLASWLVSGGVALMFIASLFSVRAEDLVPMPLSDLLAKYNAGLRSMPDCQILTSLNIKFGSGALEAKIDPNLATNTKASSTLLISGLKWRLEALRPDGSPIGPATCDGKRFQYLDGSKQLRITSLNPGAKEALLNPFNAFFAPFSYLLSEQNIGNGMYTVLPSSDLPGIFKSATATHVNWSMKDHAVILAKDLFSQGRKMGVLTMEWDGANAFYPTRAKVVSDTGILRAEYMVTNIGYLDAKVDGVDWKLPYPKEARTVEYADDGSLSYEILASIKVEFKKLELIQFTVDPNTADSINDLDANVIIPTHVTR